MKKAKKMSVAVPTPTNPVAKFANQFNKCAKMKDKRRAVKNGQVKHKGSEVYSGPFSFMVCA